VRIAVVDGCRVDQGDRVVVCWWRFAQRKGDLIVGYLHKYCNVRGLSQSSGAKLRNQEVRLSKAKLYAASKQALDARFVCPSLPLHVGLRNKFTKSEDQSEDAASARQLLYEY
jgi:hypothetical protein